MKFIKSTGKKIAIATSIFMMSLTASAEIYPSKPVKFINPFAPGGYSDLLARTFAKELSLQLKQPVVVENRPGAGGSLGIGVLAAAKADGYTIGMGTNGPLTINHVLLGNLSYDTNKDLKPIIRFAKIPSLVLVNSSSGISDFKDLIKQIKNNPDKFSYASGGEGTSQNLAGEILKSMGNLKLTHIPYKGESPAITELIGGQVPIGISSVVAALPHIQSGRLKALAITSEKINPAMPETPTIAENGFPGFDVSAWFGIVAPKNLPDDIKEKLFDAGKKAVESESFIKALEPIGAEINVMNPNEFKDFIKSESNKLEPILKKIKNQSK